MEAGVGGLFLGRGGFVQHPAVPLRLCRPLAPPHPAWLNRVVAARVRVC